MSYLYKFSYLTQVVPDTVVAVKKFQETFYPIKNAKEYEAKT